LPCAICRARKKRCFHSPDGPGGDGSHVETSPRPSHPSSNDSSGRESSLEPDRIGAYAPVNLLQEISATDDTIRSDVSPSSFSTRPSHDGLVAQLRHRRVQWHKANRCTISSPVLSASHRAYLEDAGAFTALPSVTVHALLPVYIGMLDDLVPVVDGPRLLRDATTGNASIHLVKAICLVTCKYPQAAPHLHLVADGPAVSQKSFATAMMTALDAAMHAELETDGLNRIRILALIHLHNDGTRGREQSSLYLSNAINQAWGLAIHHDCRRPEDPKTEFRSACDNLWWTLRNMDRLSKLVMGVAPFLIDDSDIGIERVSSGEDDYRSSIMALSTALGDLVATATSFYKASLTGPLMHVRNSAYLELWYHLAAMMSCCSGLPGTDAYLRRLSSAERVIAILGDKAYIELPPLPLVPYVLSVATIVVYRSVIDRQRPVQEVLLVMKDCCDTLDGLSQLWTSASGFVKVAKWLFKQLVLYRPPHLHQMRKAGLLNGSDRLSAAIDDVTAPVPLARLDSYNSETSPQSQGMWSVSEVATEEALLGWDLGQGLDNVVFDVYANMENAGFFDYLDDNNSESHV
ncbi:hypothetical protein M409DRAFT_37810, partial [Zasmidium cellare ATCC 36951]